MTVDCLLTSHVFSFIKINLTEIEIQDMWSRKGTRIIIEQLIFPHGLVSFSRSRNRHRSYVYELRFSGGVKKQMKRSVELVEQEILNLLMRVQESESLGLEPLDGQIVGAKRPHEEVEPLAFFCKIICTWHF